MKYIVSALAVIAASTLAAAPAAAEGRYHDGFLLRLAPTVGPISITQKVTFMGQSGPEATISGVMAGFELQLGGTVAPGLEIGGSMFGGTASDPDFEVGGTSEVMKGTLTLAAVGLHANYYLNPEQGLYLHGSLGFGALSFEQTVNGTTTSAGNDPSGVVIGLGVGYDFWVAEEWSIGPLARLMYGSLSYDEGGGKWEQSVLYPHLGVGFTFH